MKTMKKFAALLLVVVLMAAMLVVPANAAGGDLQISDSLDGVSYNLYKVFDLKTSGTAYSYTVNASWVSFFKTGDGAAYVTLKTVGDIHYVESVSDYAALAKAAEKYAQGLDDVAGTSDDVVAPSESKTGDGNTLTFNIAQDGYYVVGTSLRNQAAFGATINGSTATTVTEKNALPTVDKTSTGSAGVGDTVKYFISINVEGTVDEHYIVVDNMSNGKLELVAGSLTVTGVAADKVTVDYPFTVGANTKAIKITVDKDALNALAAGAEVKISYDALVVEAGVIKNEVTLNGSTGDDNSDETSYNYNIDITKKAGSIGGNVLAGAKFVLTNGDGKYAKHDTDGNFIGWMEAAAAEPTTGNYVTDVIWTSDADGKIAIVGVPAGTYTLKEIEAPDGYKLADNTTITITDTEPDGIIDGDTDNTISVTVVNNTGSMFPSTGGVGTTIFYTLGGIMVLAAVVFIITRRRMIEE